MSLPLLQVAGLSKQFKKFTFGPIDLEIEPGVAVALIGANGAGKSTFFHLLMQLLQPDAGDIYVFGRKMKQDEVAVKQKIGFALSGLFQAYSHLSIEKVASLRRYWYPSWDDQQFAALVQRYQIDVKQTYGDSSTGTQKKIEFIFALSHQPELLLLDEPTSGVDMISQTRMKEDMIRFLESGHNSLIIATHQQEEIQQLCDRICVLHEGKLVHSVEKEDVEQSWARLWVTRLPDAIRSHPDVIEMSDSPCQLVTKNRTEIERILEEQGAAPTHSQPLQLHEVFAYVVNHRFTR